MFLSLYCAILFAILDYSYLYIYSKGTVDIYIYIYNILKTDTYIYVNIYNYIYVPL